MYRNLNRRNERSYKQPSRFKPAGEVADVRLSREAPGFIPKTPKLKGKKAEGIKYENKAHGYIEGLTDYYLPSPWLHFQMQKTNTWRWCQPDGLICDMKQGKITIIEFKLQHTVQAWWQLRRLYEPVVKKLFGEKFTYSMLEIARWVDPDIDFPEHYTYIKDPMEVEVGAFGVHIWNPKH